MAIKTVLLRKKLADAKKRQQDLIKQQRALQKREEDLAKDIEEAETEEEKAAVEEAVEELETSQAETKTGLEEVKTEIEDLIAQIEESEKAQEEALEGEDESEDISGLRSRAKGEKRMNTNRMELREMEDFKKSGRHTYKNVRSLLRAAVKTSTTGVVGPTGVGGINDSAVAGVSSLIDLIKITDCTGMASYKVSYMTTDASDASAITEGSAPSEGEPGFGSVELTPSNYGTIGYVSKEIRKQSPLNYEEKVTDSARRALRRKMNSVAAAAIVASSINETFALEAASTATTGAALFDASLLSNIILAYGGDEEIDGSACLFLNKKDLKAFAAVRGANEYLPVYSIVPDTENPSTGVIKDNNGLSCRYCLSKDATALSDLTLTTTAQKTMFYGNPNCAELGIWGGFDVEVNDGYKFGEGLLTVRGEVTGDVDVTVYKGFVVVTAKKAAAAGG